MSAGMNASTSRLPSVTPASTEKVTGPGGALVAAMVGSAVGSETADPVGSPFGGASSSSSEHATPVSAMIQVAASSAAVAIRTLITGTVSPTLSPSAIEGLSLQGDSRARWALRLGRRRYGQIVRHRQYGCNIARVSCAGSPEEEGVRISATPAAGEEVT